MNRSDASAGAVAIVSSPSRRWGRWVALLSFSFFLIKGLAWLVVPAAIAALSSR